MGRLRRLLALLVGGVAPLVAPLACSTFGSEADQPKTEDGAVTADGATRDDVGSSIDGGEPDDSAVKLPDASFSPDGALTPFTSTCQSGDKVESESNESAGEANTFTAAICGRIAGKEDRDWYSFEVKSTSPVQIGFAADGDAAFYYAGPGGGRTSGANSPPTYRAFVFKPSTVGFISFQVTGSAQPYRLAVSQ